MADIILQSIIYVLIAGNEKWRKHCFQPLYADDGEPPIPFDEFIRNGKVHRMQGILLEEAPAHVPRRTIKRLMQVVVLDDENLALRTGIGERISPIVRAIPLRITAVCIDGVDRILMRERLARLQQLHAADMIGAFRGIERFQHGFPLAQRQPYFELIEQPLVVGALRAVEIFQRILDVIILRAIGELHGIERRACIKLQALRIPYIEIEPEVFLQVRIEGIAVFDQHEYLRFLAVIEGIVPDVECLSVHSAVL